MSDTEDDHDDLLEAFQLGNRQAANELFGLLYEELRGLAVRHMAAQPKEHTLQPTALANEAYVRLQRDGKNIKDRSHLLSTASRSMRQILVDHDRKKESVKRQANRGKVSADHLIEQAVREFDDTPIGLASLNATLARMETSQPEKARLVDLHVFGGQTFAECAAELGISERKAYRWWKEIRAILKAAVEDD